MHGTEYRGIKSVDGPIIVLKKTEKVSKNKLLNQLVKKDRKGFLQRNRLCSR